MKNLISQVMEDMQETVSPDAVLEVPLETNSFGDHAVGLIDANTIEDIMSVDHDLNEIGNGDDLVDVTKVLIDIDGNLRTRNENEPLSRPAAEALNIAIQHLTKCRVFAMEHFEGRHARKLGTQLAIEELGDTIRSMVQKIIRWIKRVMEVIFDHIEGMVRGANAMTKRAEELQDLANQYRTRFGDEAKDDTLVRNKALRQVFTKADGGEFTTAEIKHAYEETVKQFNETLSGKTVIAGSQALANQFQSVLNRKKTDKFTNDVALDMADKTIVKMLGENFPQFKAQSNHNELIYTPPFMGASFVLTVGEENGKANTLSLVRKDAEKSKQDELPVLRPSEVLELAKAVESSMHRGIYRDYKKIKSSMYSLKTAIADLCDEITKQQRTSFQGDMPSLHFLKTSSETLFKMVNYAYAYNGVVARSILEYGRLSLKQYGKLN